MSSPDIAASLLVIAPIKLAHSDASTQPIATSQPYTLGRVLRSPTASTVGLVVGAILIGISPVLEFYAGAGSMYNYIIAGGVLFFLSCIHKVAYRKDLMELIREGKITTGAQVRDYLDKRFYDINKKDAQGRSALYFAVQLDKADVVKAVLEHTNDKDPHIADDKGAPRPLFDQLMKDKKYDLLEILVDFLIGPEPTSTYMRTIKELAESRIDERNIDQEFHLFPGHGIDFPPLLAFQVTRYLIKHRADVNARDEYRRTPLHDVCDLRCAALLLNAKADINAEDDRGQTPLGTHKGMRDLQKLKGRVQDVRRLQEIVDFLIKQQQLA